jgi:exosome complex RNA-binding protein Csl4
VFVSTRRRSKVCEGRVDVRGARVISARASSVNSSTVRHKLDLGAVVAVCWNCDRELGLLRGPG